MSPPDRPRPGVPITVRLAPQREGGPPIPVTVVPIEGRTELALAEGEADGRASVEVESDVLRVLVRPAGLSTEIDSLLPGDRARLTLAALCAGYGAPPALFLTCASEACATRQEIAFDARPILDAVAEGPAGAPFDAGGLRLRLPLASDLIAAGGDGAMLAGRCILEPATVDSVAVLEAEIARRDPCAEIVLTAACTECGEPLDVMLDPLVLLRAEMAREGGILAEIDRIAHVYHWSEAEILALPAHRRRKYLTFVAARTPETMRWVS